MGGGRVIQSAFVESPDSLFFLLLKGPTPEKGGIVMVGLERDDPCQVGHVGSLDAAHLFKARRYP